MIGRALRLPVVCAAVIGTAVLTLVATASPSGAHSRIPPRPATVTPADSAGYDWSRQPVPLYELTPPTGGDFYTLSAEEAATAAGQYGFSRQPGYFGYLWLAPFPGSEPIYRLRYTGGGYLYSRSTDERDSLVRSGRFVDEGVLGYGYAAAHAGTIQLDRFARNNTWRIAPESAAQQLVAEGFHDDGALTWAAPQAVQAGAIYFGTWDNQSTMIMNATQQWLGRSGDWWGGVRDYSGRDSSVGHAIDKYKAYWGDADFSDREPSIGFYDDTDVSTVAKQIDQANGAGLDFFSFYWYWDAVNHRQTIDGGLDTFLKTPNRNSMNFMVTLCASPPQQGDDLHIPHSDFDTVTQSIVTKYLSQPNYERDNEGRPMVQLCDHRGIGDGAANSPEQIAQAVEFQNLLRQKAKSQLGLDLDILGNDDLMRSRGGGVNGLVKQLGVDGTACMARFGEVNGSYQTYVSTLKSYMDDAPPVYGRCLESNFDERPRYPILYPPGTESQVRYFKDQTPQLFSQAVSTVDSDIANSTRISPIDNFTFIYAWNEWHEGGYIEPNMRDGCKYLDLIQTGLHLGGSGCVPDPAVN